MPRSRDHLVRSLIALPAFCDESSPCTARRYEFNGHWNNYTAGGYIAAWRRIVAAIGKVPRAREATATVWDMSCDAVRGHDGCTSADECCAEYWPGDDVVDCATPMPSAPHVVCIDRGSERA